MIRLESSLSNSNVIEGFTNSSGSGGIYTLLSKLAVHNSWIVHNHATGSGGGIRLDHCLGTITNTILTNNTDSALLVEVLAH